MTRQEARDLLPIIQAFAEGKTIQFYCSGKDKTSYWADIEPNENIGFSDCVSKYRIKPGPKYRPFENGEECLKEMLKHQPYGWVKYKETKSLITEVSSICVTIGKDYYFKEAKEVFTFTDGTPFGIKEEE